MPRSIIEIHGAGQRNKGAALMLRTTVEQIGKRCCDVGFAIDPTYGDFDWRCRQGLWQMYPMRGHIGSPRFSSRFRMQRAYSFFKVEQLREVLNMTLLSAYGCVSTLSSRALVDISGFALSDQWGERPLYDMAMLTRFYRKSNKPVILLPQAFGPFSTPKMRSLFKRVVENSTLVFARDEMSLGYLRDIVPDAPHVALAPDITIFSESSIHTEDTHSPYVCVVPNIRTVSDPNGWSRDAYIQAMAGAIRIVSASGYRVVMVIHDTTGGDDVLADAISYASHNIPIHFVRTADGQELKALLGCAAFVVGSRFHSIVSALSCAVPAVVLGWSHKYEALLHDFCCGQFLASAHDGVDGVLSRCELLMQAEFRKGQKSVIAEKRAQMHATWESMWNRVVACLKPSL